MEDALSFAVCGSVSFSVSFTASCSEELQRKVGSETNYMSFIIMFEIQGKIPVWWSLSERRIDC